MRLLKVLCCAAAVIAFTVPAAHADEWNKLTYFTFSGPVQIPGATLPAGTYTFKIADILGTRHIVQIYNEDQTKIIATLLAIPNDLGEDHAADKPIVMFSETPAGQPAAVKAWFYPGRRIGDEFVYPKAQATRIAKAYHSPVLSTDRDTMGNKNDWQNARVGHMDENGRMTDDNGNSSASAQNARNSTDTDRAADQAARTAPATGSRQTSATATPANVAENQSQPARNTDRSNTSDMRADRQQGRNANGNGSVGTSGQTASQSTARSNRSARRLPATASSFDLIALLGGLSFAGGIATARLRRRLAATIA